MNNGITFLEAITIRRFYTIQDNDFWPNNSELKPIKIEVFQNFKALYKKNMLSSFRNGIIRAGGPKVGAEGLTALRRS